MHYFPKNGGASLPWQYYASLPVLLVMIWLVVRKTRFRKEILFGAFFFLITVSVMLQIVPVGKAHLAERYTYVPYIGLLFIVGHMISEIKKKRLKNIFIAIMLLLAVVFSYQTWDRISVWKDGYSLFDDVIKKNPENYHGYYVRASLRSKGGDMKGALEDYDKAIEYKPDFVVGLVNRGDIRNKMNDNRGALEDLNRAISMDSTQPFAYLNRGIANSGAGNIHAALLDYNKVIKLNPNIARAYGNRGILKAQSGDTTGVMEDFNKAIKMAPDDAESYSNRGSYKKRSKRF